MIPDEPRTGVYSCFSMGSAWARRFGRQSVPCGGNAEPARACWREGRWTRALEAVPRSRMPPSGRSTRRSAWTGSPESATGQSTLLTGVNVPQAIGGHYGPKPDPRIRAIMQEAQPSRPACPRPGRKARLLNAYPDSYFEAIRSGRRLHAAIPLAFALAEIPLGDRERSRPGTGRLRRFHRARMAHAGCGGPSTPVLNPEDGGPALADLCARKRFHDVRPLAAGLRGALRRDARRRPVVERAGPRDRRESLEVVRKSNLTVLLSSDHGNMEDLSDKGHTRNAVPVLALGPGCEETDHRTSSI